MVLTPATSGSITAPQRARDFVNDHSGVIRFLLETLDDRPPEAAALRSLLDGRGDKNILLDHDIRYFDGTTGLTPSGRHLLEHNRLLVPRGAIAGLRHPQIGDTSCDISIFSLECPIQRVDGGSYDHIIDGTSDTLAYCVARHAREARHRERPLLEVMNALRPASKPILRHYYHPEIDSRIGVAVLRSGKDFYAAAETDTKAVGEQYAPTPILQLAFSIG